MNALTGYQWNNLKALKQTGGYLERESHSKERADVQPARRLEGFSFWHGFSRQGAKAIADHGRTQNSEASLRAYIVGGADITARRFSAEQLRHADRKRGFKTEATATGQSFPTPTRKEQKPTAVGKGLLQAMGVLWEIK